MRKIHGLGVVLYKTNKITGSAFNVEEPDLTPTIFETFDECFDLTLLVGTSPTAQFRVDSRAMRRACNPWKVMLYGNFTEKKPEAGDWIVSFPEDDYESFKTVLHLIHGDTSKVPKQPHMGTLYYLLEFIDKWDLFKLFAPWREHWIKQLEKEKRSLRGLWCHGEYLFIAWVLGFGHFVGSIIQQLVRHSRYDKKGRLLLLGTECHDIFLIPESQIDRDIFISKSSSYHDNAFINSYIEAVETGRRTLAERYWQIWHGIRAELPNQNESTCKCSQDSDESRHLCGRGLAEFLRESFSCGRIPSEWLHSCRTDYPNVCLEGFKESLISDLSNVMDINLSLRHKVCDPDEKLFAEMKESDSKKHVATFLTPTLKNALLRQRKRWGLNR